MTPSIRIYFAIVLSTTFICSYSQKNITHFESGSNIGSDPYFIGEFESKAIFYAFESKYKGGFYISDYTQNGTKRFASVQDIDIVYDFFNNSIPSGSLRTFRISGNYVIGTISGFSKNLPNNVSLVSIDINNGTTNILDLDDSFLYSEIIVIDQIPFLMKVNGYELSRIKPDDLMLNTVAEFLQPLSILTSTDEKGYFKSGSDVFFFDSQNFTRIQSLEQQIIKFTRISHEDELLIATNNSLITVQDDEIVNEIEIDTENLINVSSAPDYFFLMYNNGRRVISRKVKSSDGTIVSGSFINDVSTSRYVMSRVANTEDLQYYVSFWDKSIYLNEHDNSNGQVHSYHVHDFPSDLEAYWTGNSIALEVFKGSIYIFSNGIGEIPKYSIPLFKFDISSKKVESSQRYTVCLSEVNQDGVLLVSSSINAKGFEPHIVSLNDSEIEPQLLIDLNNGSNRFIHSRLIGGKLVTAFEDAANDFIHVQRIDLNGHVLGSEINLPFRKTTSSVYEPILQTSRRKNKGFALYGATAENLILVYDKTIWLLKNDSYELLRNEISNIEVTIGVKSAIVSCLIDDTYNLFFVDLESMKWSSIDINKGSLVDQVNVSFNGNYIVKLDSANASRIILLDENYMIGYESEWSVADQIAILENSCILYESNTRSLFRIHNQSIDAKELIVDDLPSEAALFLTTDSKLALLRLFPNAGKDLDVNKTYFISDNSYISVDVSSDYPLGFSRMKSGEFGSYCFIGNNLVYVNHSNLEYEIIWTHSTNGFHEIRKLGEVIYFEAGNSNYLVFSEGKTIWSLNTDNQIYGSPNMSVGKKGLMFISGLKFYYLDFETQRMVLLLDLTGSYFRNIEIVSVDDKGFIYTVDGPEKWELYYLGFEDLEIKKIDSYKPGFFYSSYERLGRNIYFTKWTSQYGYEPHYYNLDTGKSEIMVDIEPGIQGSHPGDYFEYNDNIYCFARTSTNDFQLWNLTGSSLVEQESVLSRQDFSDSFDFKIIPNPVDSYLRIDYPFNLESTFTICNLIGRVFLKGKLETPQINIDNLPTGNYLFILESKKGKLAKRFNKN